ncbi:MAG: aromatic ring-hydroxylating dioxygenase subunit alpha [Betaproteobacteria bacterium]|nr:aromatic ring-hydroxylating dioxygenase subunit alpha [Betaproteobacteria bacterium]
MLDDWHPVAGSSSLVAGKLLAVRLLGREVVLWRDPMNDVHAWEDRCPHRGTRLSIGHVEGAEVVCAYHGWHYGTDARCTRVPALPELSGKTQAKVMAYRAEEKYGLVWVCIGEPVAKVLPFPEYADPNLRKVLCGPYDVATSGPRIVENFLDMAHFAMVHTGILGDPGRTEVRDYDVAEFDDGQGGKGILATHCHAWQPQTNSLAHGGSEVEYTYRVVRPLTAILTKLPQAQSDFREAISLHVQPVEEELSRVWIILALTNFVQSEDELRAFQDRIFLQDKPILENQVPKKLPLDPGAEMPVRCDRMSLAYRRYLRDKALRYGVLTAAAPVHA